MDGDLISRKALLEILNAKSDVAIATPAQMIYANVAKIVELLPAVDAEPVRHSKWVCRTPGVFSCGACLGLAIGNLPTHYCPECGARMDGDGDGRS